MKYGLILLLCVLNACQSQNKVENIIITDDEKQIAKDLIQGSFDDLWAGADSTKILKYHTEDFFILEQGEIWNNERIKQSMRKKIAKRDRPSRINKMEYIYIEKYGESIQIAYWNDADYIKEDSIVKKARWLESALAVKTLRGWRLKMVHSTKVKVK